MDQNPPFPSPEELKSKLSEFMKTNFGDKVQFAAFTQPDAADASGEEKPPKAPEDEFAFEFLPRDIKAHLDHQGTGSRKGLSCAVILDTPVAPLDEYGSSVLVHSSRVA